MSILIGDASSTSSTQAEALTVKQKGPLHAAVTTVTATGDANIDALIEGTTWSTTLLTYNFPATPGYYGVDYSDELEQQNGFGRAPTQVQNAVRNILSTEYARYINITFSEVGATEAADISVAFSNDPSPTAWAYGPDPAQVGGDVWFSYNNNWYAAPVRGNYAWATILHELGHSMGLMHGHQGNGLSGAPMESDRDSMEFSIMTYRSYIGGPDTGYTNEDFGFAQTLMMYDIAALQAMYGANYNTNSGDTTYSWNQNSGTMYLNGVAQAAPGANRIFMTLWDGGGIDTYDLSSYSTALNIDLAPGGWSTFSQAQLAALVADGSQMARANVFNALLANGDMRSIIENAIGGGGNDTIAGNVANNVLSGNTGDDTLRGLEGDDTLNGGFGNDRLEGGDGIDTLNGGAGHDSLYGGIGDDLLNGDGGNDLIYGDEGVDTLNGGAGDDTLDGQGGADRIDGGDGNDTIIWDATDDLANVLGGNGIDTLKVTGAAPLTFDLTAHQFEAARVTQTDTGNIQSWASIEEDYLAGWILKQQLIRNDNGSSQIARYDVASTNVWDYTIEYFNASGRVTGNFVHYDAGNSYATILDTASTQSWSSYTVYNDSMNRRTSISFKQDDGTSYGTAYDAAGLYDWATTTNYVDASNRTTQSRVIYDDGHQVLVQYDPANTRGWRTLTDYLDTMGRRTGQDAVFDDGRTASFRFDVDDVQTWAMEAYVFDAQGVQIDHYFA